MKTFQRLIRLLLTAGLAVFIAPTFSQDGAHQARASAGKVEELEGTITTVLLGTPGAQSRGGQGCHVGVKTTAGDQVDIGLGPMRYLLEQSFSPEAGDAIEVSAIPSRGSTTVDFVAVTARLPKKKREIKLRTADGYPLWGGRRRRGGQSRP